MNYDALLFGFGFVMIALFTLAALGMAGGPHRTAGRPPEQPPGRREQKDAKRNHD